jgi:ferric-dicitrate binding protein FerR (iron transport regulator)
MRTTELEIEALSNHEAALAALPFYVTGALDADEHAQVERHIRHCVACRRELANEQRTHQAFKQFDFDGSQADTALQNFWSKHEPTAPVRSLPAPSRRYRMALPLAAAASLVLAVSAGWQWWSQQAAPVTSPYRTLAAGEVPHYQLRGDARVMFRADTSRTRAQVTLEMYGFELLAGPDALGVYSIQRKPDASQPFDAALLALGSHDSVVLARATVTGVPR